MPYARKNEIVWTPGHYYHLFNRGARQITIFREEKNYHFVLYRVKKYCREFDLTVIAYCLMPNHYHFLVRQNSEPPAGLLPQRVFNSYTKAYNKMYERSGTLFERRYQAIPVETESHLKHLCRYIHTNPVKDGIVSHPEAWLYSNYLEWIGQRPGTIFDVDFIHTFFGDIQNYKSFVEKYVTRYYLPEELKYLKEI